MKYSQERKQAAVAKVAKLAPPHKRTAKEVAAEEGISPATLCLKKRPIAIIFVRFAGWNSFKVKSFKEYYYFCVTFFCHTWIRSFICLLHRIP